MNKNNSKSANRKERRAAKRNANKANKRPVNINELAQIGKYISNLMEQPIAAVDLNSASNKILLNSYTIGKMLYSDTINNQIVNELESNNINLDEIITDYLAMMVSMITMSSSVCCKEGAKAFSFTLNPSTYFMDCVSNDIDIIKRKMDKMFMKFPFVDVEHIITGINGLGEIVILVPFIDIEKDKLISLCEDTTKMFLEDPSSYYNEYAQFAMMTIEEIDKTLNLLKFDDQIESDVA